MRDVVHVLERRAGVVVPESKGAVVTAGKEHPLGIDGERVDDGVVPAKVEHERAFGAFPLFDVVTPS